MDPSVITELIKNGGMVAGAIVLAYALIAVLKQQAADRSAMQDLQAPAMDQLKGMYETGTQFLAANTKTVEATMVRLQRSLDREEQDSATLRKELLETSKRVASLEAQNKEQSRVMEANMALINSMQSRIQELERLNADATNRIKELEYTNRDSSARIEDLEAQAIQDRRLIASLQDDIAKRSAEITSLKDKLREVEDDRAKVAKERDDRDERITVLTKEMQVLRAQVEASTR